MRDEKGKVSSVRYEAVNSMLLNEFLKEHQKAEEQEARLTKQEAKMAEREEEFRARIAQQEKEIQTLAATLKKQASALRQVSAQLESEDPVRQMVANKP